VLVTLIKLIYSSVHVSNFLVLTFRYKLINFFFQIFPLFTPEMPAGFTSCIVRVMAIYLVSIP
jgi:hypothetical protein